MCVCAYFFFFKFLFSFFFFFLGAYIELESEARVVNANFLQIIRVYHGRDFFSHVN